MLSATKSTKDKTHAPEENLYETGDPIVLSKVEDLREKAQKNHQMTKELQSIEARYSNLGKYLQTAVV
jgi:hypothetical protein